MKMLFDQKSPRQISAAIWALCNVLRDDGVVFHKYMSELTYLLFLKVADQIGSEAGLPIGHRWRDLQNHPMPGIVGFYRKMLTSLGEDAPDPLVREIFGFPTTVFSHDENLHKVVQSMEALDWSGLRGHAFGLLYEGLLERNATEARSGGGQYFTPRALVESVVRMVDPQPGELIQDPSTGTGGFLCSAHDHLVAKYGSDAATTARYEGIEIERDTYRLCLMNMHLHGMSGRIVHGDALTDDAAALSAPDLVLANPPFGSAAGGARPRRADLAIQTSNKQLSFLQHVLLTLKEGGRAAVVVPDNVLFDPGAGRAVRAELMRTCDLHTILRLPQGIFYAAGVNTNVLFFDKTGPTSAVRFYDMRSHTPRFSKKAPLTASAFEAFERACRRTADRFDNDPRVRVVDRAAIEAAGDDLDAVSRSQLDPERPDGRASAELLAAIAAGLEGALAQLRDLEGELTR
jgi:type I restriction enzyme M protein